MPAVELDRLHTQIQLLIKEYASPRQFVKSLRALYEFYSDRTYSPLVLGAHSPSGEAYNVTPIINRQFELEFGKLCEENQLSTMDVIDQLWEEPKLEPRRLAAVLLGKIPLSFSGQVIKRLQDWSLPTEDRALIQYLHEHGTIRLRREAVEEWTQVIRSWLESKDTDDQIFGLQSLIPLINDREYKNLPLIFDLLSLRIAEPNPRILFTLQNVIEALARRSPIETVYYLKTILKGKHSKDLPRFFRRLLACFPEDQAQSLRAALKEEA